jgi:diacylglycerol kinase family enzyme
MSGSDSTRRPDRPRASRRLAALAAIGLLVAVVVGAVGAVLSAPLVFAVQVALVLVAFAAVWVALTRRGAARWAGVAVAALAAAGVLLLLLGMNWREVLTLLLGIAVLILVGGLARYAVALDVRSLKRSRTPGRAVAGAAKGVLIMNLRSGGGKAERFHLEEECRARGIEPVVLTPGDDLLQLAHAAVDRGADVLGMAGGDGSQALVASVAAAHGVSMVVVPAGTRNHFALDLGLDRDDVVGALDAYGHAYERTIDLADVNGRVFVNNVSLGLYATIVQSPEYRDAKRETALAALPDMLGPESRPFDLRFAGPDGAAQDGAHVLQVSNNPYGTTLLTLASRPRLDAGTLGVFALLVPNALAATEFIAQLAAGRPDGYRGLFSWSTPSFRVDSDAPVAVGLDGEALELDPPLLFTSRPGVLRVRLPGGAIGYSPAARSRPLRTLIADVWRTALGRAPERSA